MRDQFSLYSQKVMEHFRNPRNVGEIKDPDGIGHVGNPICGDIMELYIKVKDDVIVDAKFKTFGCLPRDEKIVGSKGSWLQAPGVVKGDEVLNSDGQATFVGPIYTRKYKGQLIKIEPFVSPYNTFSLTPEHPVLCVKRSKVSGSRISSRQCSWLRVEKDNLLSTKPDYLKAKDLRMSDYLIFSYNHHIKDNKFFTNEMMRLIGYYLAEGYTAAKGNSVAFAFDKKEVNLINDVRNILRKISKRKPKERTIGNVTEVYICDVKLARMLTNLAGRHARRKKLAPEIMVLPFKKQWEMLKTYFAGDGDTYRRRKNNNLIYRVITTSENIAIQLQEIMARGGIFASIKTVYKPEHKIEVRKIKASKMYMVSFMLDKKHSFVKSNNEYFLVPIRKVSKIAYRGEVYNFQVFGEPNSYLVKGFAVHNCGAAIATSSMVTELVKGKTVDEALKISNRAVAEALGGLPPVKMHCSVLAEEALKSAIKDYYERKKKKEKDSK